MGVILKMDGRQRKLEPNSVPTNYSVWEGLSVERNNVVRSDVVVGVYGLIYT